MISHLQNSQGSGASTCICWVRTPSSLLLQEFPKGTGTAFLSKIQTAAAQQSFNQVKQHRRDATGTRKWAPCGGQKQLETVGNLERDHCSAGDAHARSNYLVPHIDTAAHTARVRQGPLQDGRSAPFCGLDNTVTSSGCGHMF